MFLFPFQVYLITFSPHDLHLVDENIPVFTQSSHNVPQFGQEYLLNEEILINPFELTFLHLAQIKSLFAMF